MNGAELNGVIGNVTRDPVLRFSSSGKPWTTFGIAVNRVRTAASGEKTETTVFFDVKCFNQMAENVAESVSKGMRVAVSGAIEVREWDGQDGQKRTTIEITADEVSVSLRWATAQVTKTPSGGGGNGNGGGYGNGAPRAAAGNTRQATAPAAAPAAEEENPFGESPF